MASDSDIISLPVIHSDANFIKDVMYHSAKDVMAHISAGVKWNRPFALSADETGFPLHFAIRSLNEDVVYLLLELGADPNLISGVDGSLNMSPLQYAKSFVRENDDEDGESINFEAKEMVDIIEKHINTVKELEELSPIGEEISSKIAVLSRTIADAKETNRQMKELTEEYIRKNNSKLEIEVKLLEVKRLEKCLADQKRAIEAEKRSLDDGIEKIVVKRNERSWGSSFMSDSKMSYHQNLLNLLERKKNSVVVKAIGSDLECVVCLSLPTTGNIYSCSSCVNILCFKCFPKLFMCPTCRQDFRRRPCIRNLALERIAHKLTV